jgi:hypothetical protein
VPYNNGRERKAIYVSKRVLGRTGSRADDRGADHDGPCITCEVVAEETLAERAAHLPAASEAEPVHAEQHEVHHALQWWADCEARTRVDALVQPQRSSRTR